MRLTQHSQPEQALTWEVAIPLLGDRRMMRNIITGFGVTFLLAVGLLSFVFGTQGEWESILPMMGMFGVLLVGLALVSLGVMAIAFGNRLALCYTLTDEGIRFELLSPVVRTSNRLAILLSALTKQPGVAGAGLLAKSQETQEVHWHGAFTADYDGKARVIALRNRWRTVMWVYCTPENYETVAGRVRSAMARHRTQTRAKKRRSALPGALGRSALVLMACVPVFKLGEVFPIHLLLPIALLCFALAMVWLTEVMGWVVLGISAAIVVAATVDAFSIRESVVFPGQRYVRHEVLMGEDWEIIVLAAAGLALLCWLGWRAISKRSPALLTSDQRDMGEAC